MDREWESYVNNYAVFLVQVKSQIKAVPCTVHMRRENDYFMSYDSMTHRHLRVVMGLQRGISNVFYGYIIKIRSSTEIYNN